MVLPWALCGIFGVISAILLLKILVMKKSLDEIRTGFAESLDSDTNLLVTVSSGDKYIRLLANDINKQLEILRKQRLKYERGDRELKDTATNICHDLRTPLTAICGYLELLENEEKTENVSRYFSAIQNRTEVLKALTEELFRYFVIISENEPMGLESRCLNEILEESLAGLYTEFSRKGITPEIKIPHEKIFRNVNKTALLRVFGNILSNAANYSGGDLTVELLETGEIVFSNSAEELSSVQLSKLFDRFFTVRTAGNSTGLGLSIAKNLVERMGGKISAKYENTRLGISVSFAEE